MVIFHGYVSHNQRVSIYYGSMMFLFWKLRIRILEYWYLSCQKFEEYPAEELLMTALEEVRCAWIYSHASHQSFQWKRTVHLIIHHDLEMLFLQPPELIHLFPLLLHLFVLPCQLLTLSWSAESTGGVFPRHFWILQVIWGPNTASKVSKNTKPQFDLMLVYQCLLVTNSY